MAACALLQVITTFGYTVEDEMRVKILLKR